jgi:hypothetical protein
LDLRSEEIPEKLLVFTGNEKFAQQSVHWTGGDAARLQAFSWLLVFPVSTARLIPPTCQ